MPKTPDNSDNDNAAAAPAANPYAEWFEQLRTEYADQFKLMPLPEGLPEHLHQLVTQGDEEAIQFMLKLAWQFGAQVGYAAGSSQSGEVSVIRANTRVEA